MIKVRRSPQRVPTTRKEARGGAKKWTLSHLPNGTIKLFQDAVVPFACIKAGTKAPWAGLTTGDVQAIMDKVFGEDEHLVTENDVWCGLISYRLNDWRASFGQNGLKTVEQLFKDNMDEFDTKDAITNLVNTLLTIPEGEETAPFIWREWVNGKKKGIFQAELILNVFALAHLYLFDDPFDCVAGDHKPTGALLLSMQV
ncbi:hypothetical protein C0991_010893, partial [Blastosporella zonata]